MLHLAKSAEHWGKDGRAAALVLACNIGWRAKVDGHDGALLLTYFDETPWGRLLLDTATASHHLELGQGAAALEHVEQAIARASAQDLGTGDFWARLQLVKGDVYYLLQDLGNAAHAYAEGASASSPLSFEHAWCSWRSGALGEDPDACRDAARAFGHLGLHESWARALGAHGALLIKSGRMAEGLRSLEELLEAYFVKREALAGPALAVAQAHIVRLGAELEGRSVPDADFPGFGADAYERVLSSAQPRSGPAVAYYVLGDVYGLLDEVDAARRAFTRAVELLGEDTLSKNILPLLVKRSLDNLSGGEADSALTRKCVHAILQQQASDDSAAPSVLALCLLSAPDRHFAEGRGDGYLTMLLDILQEILPKYPSLSDFWNAEVLLRRARMAETQGDDTSAVVSRYRAALERGRRAHNGSVVLQAGHVLGFELATQLGSFREIAFAQFAVLDGVEADRVYVLDRGAVTHEGPARALLEDLDLRARVLWF